MIYNIYLGLSSPFITVTSLGVGFLWLVWCFSFKYLAILVYLNVKWH